MSARHVSVSRRKPMTSHSAVKSSPGSLISYRRRRFRYVRSIALTIGILAALAPGKANGAMADDEKQVAALDTQYQAAVKINDAVTMARILADDFILVTGRGQVYKRTDLLEDAQ